MSDQRIELETETPALERGLGVWQATALNVANMVGIGPFITIPAFIAAMNGPQAIIGWIIAAGLVLCDGLVWSELGAALPGSGGSYHFLREIFGRYRWGQIVPFLFIWQFLVSGALEMASGSIGAARYIEYALPGIAPTLAEWGIANGTAWIAALATLAVTLLVCQRIKHIGLISIVLCTGTMITVLTVIILGLLHFDSSLLTLPANAFQLDNKFAVGLGAAMLIAIYDYLGYYNICHLGDEVVEPAKTIPRAIIISVVVVAAIYLTMNISIIAVIPWQEAMKSNNIAADFMEHLFGRNAAVLFSGLIVWTAVASVFALTLGYSRIPFAAARRGDFFRAFAIVHPTRGFPVVSLFALGMLTSVFCFFDLADVISAAVCVRILVQFVGQIIGLHLLRTTRKDVVLPFRMWGYPIPSVIATTGWLFILLMAERKILLLSLAVFGSGIVAYAIWELLRRRRLALEGDSSQDSN